MLGIEHLNGFTQMTIEGQGVYMVNGSGDIVSGKLIEGGTGIQNASTLYTRSVMCDSAEERMELGKKAMELEPSSYLGASCIAFAYCDLAYEAKKDSDKVKLYTSALLYAQRAVQTAHKEHPEFERAKTLEHRTPKNEPYMRLLHLKAILMKRENRLEEALVVAQRLIQLNPKDNQNVRYIAIPLLIQLGQLKKAKMMVDQFSWSQCPHTTWFGALLSFALKKEEIFALRCALILLWQHIFCSLIR